MAMIDLTRTIQVLADLRPPLQPVAAPSVPDFSQLPQLAQVFGNNPSQFMADHRVLIQDSHELIQLLAQASYPIIHSRGHSHPVGGVCQQRGQLGRSHQAAYRDA